MGSGTLMAGEFAQYLRELRICAGLSQEELAHASGVSVRALADLERGRTRGPQRRTVQALTEALGLDPVAAQKLEQTARLGRPRPRQTTARSPHNTLALPRDLGDFTARGPALAQLLALAERPDGAHPPVTVVSGQPGLGKTSFAVHAAHRLAPHFPDGQFALDLHGMDPQPVTVRDALARLLRGLGVAESAIPAATDDRSGLLRSVVADRRLLLLLDNAADEAQVRPLLPATGDSLTIITSRRTLAGFESVHRTDLSLLRREEAVELLTRIVGVPRVQQEAQAARDLVDLCGHLPLAVRIAGQRLASRPNESLGRLVAQLGDEGRRLDTLQAGDLQVRAAFALSYQHLDPAARTLFRRASLAVGPDFSSDTAALLSDLPPHRAVRYAEELTDAGLLYPDPTAERYRFHDLIKSFAIERAAEEDGPAVCEAAQDRAAQWILRRATAAALRFDAEYYQNASDADPDPTGGPADLPAARTWLEAERAQWLAALRHAQTTGRHQQVIDAAEAMHWFSDLTQHWEVWAEVFQTAVDAARALGSRKDEAVHLNYLAWAYNLCLHDPHAGLASADAALAVAREIGDSLQEGWSLGYGAGALHRLGRVDESFDRFWEAAACLGAQTSAQARLGELSVLNTLGNNLRGAGRPEEALLIHRRSEAICRAGMPGQSAELIALYHANAQQQMGNDLAALSRWAEAEGLLRRALAHFEVAQAPSWGASAQLDLGLVLLAQGRQEARQILLAARDALGALNDLRLAEATAALRELDQLTTPC
ncbi:helix-turn-helix domain-containing protein [Streptomyces albipurpureus]|uniref:Helix-turn-helix domain-containing protein n=1 Tax=Streptomyces albipurpureus TaxID=2897419 RepID=A0ABT0UT17_9ACTN|nr:helix-turn-helix domain-containing protein [Streptomyces sp. CWNU-1]MCM2390518.1 helix-turn-helix domain-containing protein [Streptomyces sp. CWNU-1]